MLQCCCFALNLDQRLRYVKNVGVKYGEGSNLTSVELYFLAFIWLYCKYS